jgi:cytochrome c biogenesis protein CcdA/thiol-disulfide isomerase/thioredoxin
VVVLLGIAFIAGLITAVSPCVLPVLPILLAGSAGGSRSRPFAIVAGLVVSFTTFTLAGAALLSALHLPADLLRNIAIGALFVLAATLLVPRLGWLLERPLLFLTRRRVSSDANGLVLGVSLGLVFVPCAGPVLATTTALAAAGTVGVRTIVVTGAYAIGAALPMLAIAVGGQRLSSGVRTLRTHAAATRRVAGVVLGLTALAIALGVDQRFTTALPGYVQSLQNDVEASGTATRELAKLRGDRGAALAASTSSTKYPEAPEFRGIKLWLNTSGGKPVSIAGYRGKVVLVDFWTYSCINCLRTLPHLKAWDAAYRSAGLRIVGIHSPEFAFEHVPDNVRSAVKRLGLRYPVGLDNDFATWRAYQNNYWPAKYLIDRAGRVRFVHFGEGSYGETESMIRRLLGEHVRAQRTVVADETPTGLRTPETYLGYSRLDPGQFVGRVVPDAASSYRFPGPSLDLNRLAYAGGWRVEAARIVAGAGARLRLGFQAQDIYLVLGGKGRLSVLVDGRPLQEVMVSGTPRLYTLAHFADVQRGLLELRFARGLEAYAFTFG